MALLKTIIEKNPATPVKAIAAYTSAEGARAEAEGAKVKDAEIEAARAGAVKAFEAVAAEYGDVQVAGLRGTVGDAARAVINEIEKLPVGKERRRSRARTSTARSSSSATTAGRWCCSTSGGIGEAPAGPCTRTSGRS